MYFPYPRLNALCQHSMQKENISESPEKSCKLMESLETTSFACNTGEELRRLNSSVPKLVQKRFPTCCVPCEYSLISKLCYEPTWTSTFPLCTPISNTNFSCQSFVLQHIKGKNGI